MSAACTGNEGEEWDAENSAAYVNSVFYAKDSAAQKRQLKLVLDALKFDPQSRFVDIGAGNGDFTAVVAGAAKLEQKALGVEPAAAMVAMNSDAEKVSLLTSSAVDFVEVTELKGTDAGAAWPATWSTRKDGGAGAGAGGAAESNGGNAGEGGAVYDRVLVKEVVHLLGESPARRRIFQGMYAQVAKGGLVCVFTRPQVPAYPIPPAGMKVWGGHDTAEYHADLEAAGFAVTTTRDVQMLQMPRQAWLGLVRGRVWSTFSKVNFDEEAHAQLVKDTDAMLSEWYGDQQEISIKEEYVIIVGVKS